MSFPRYPKYKASGVEWLGDVPDGWDVKPLKYSTFIYTGNSLNETEKKFYESANPEALPYISSKDIDLETHRVQYENGLRIPRAQCDLKVAQGGTFLLCIEGGSAGRKVALLSQDVCFVNKLCCFSSRKNNKFRFYFAQSQNFKDKFRLSLTGLIGGVSTSLLQNFQIPIPSDPEQTHIAAFLDRETAKIDALVAEQRRLMELLKEKRQAVISHAVTQGLNPHAPMKPSGIEWLGDVPEHWEIGPVKRHIARVESGTSVNSSDEPAEDWKLGVLKTSCVYTGKFEPTENKTVVLKDIGRVSCPLKAGTIIVSRMNTPELIGAAGFVDSAPSNLFLPDRLWQISFSNADARFVHFWTLTSLYRAQVESVCTGTSSSMKNLGQDQFGSFAIAMPPKEEQALITSFLDREIARFDTLTAEAQRAIDLLQERRTALISAAVTGQIDVREVAGV